MHSDWVNAINSKVSGASATHEAREIGDSPIFVAPEYIKSACETLKASCGFNVLQVITGCDYEDRIEVSYILANYTTGDDLILKIKLPRDNPKVESVCGVWKAANYQERECYDMLGVTFEGHPDHRRILCPDDWEGFPLRKDYQAAEKYKHMTIYPEDKMNFPERQFADKQKEAEKAAKAAKKDS